MMSHDRFVYLTDSEQEQVIIKTMEFVADLESRYQYEVATYGYDQKRFRLYSSIMNKVVSLLISSAHADSTLKNLETAGIINLKIKNPVTKVPLVIKQTGDTKTTTTPEVPELLAKPKKSWEDLAEDFHKQVTTPSRGKVSGKCIYGGWVSEMQGNPGLCVHPNFINPKNPGSVPETKTYINQNGCNGKNQITCNPVIFGYKSESEKSLFCVPAGLPESHNSALSCMKAALSDKVDAHTDSKEERIQNLRKRLVAKPAAFENVQKFIYQYCVCETSPNGTNKSYHERVRPHRTCFGMIEMVAETSICEEPKIDIDTTIFRKLRDAAASDSISKSSGGSAIDGFYKRFLGDVKTSAPAEYRALCPNDNVPEIAGPEKGPEKGPETKPEVKVDGPKKYACEKVACKPNGDKDKPGLACDYKFIVEGTSEAATPEKAPTEVPAPDAKELKVTVSFDGKPHNLTCAISHEEQTPKDPDKNPTLKVVLKEKTDKTQNLTADTTDADDLTIIWIRKDFPTPKKDADKKEEGPKITVAGLDDEEEKKEEEKKEEKPDDKKEEEKKEEKKVAEEKKKDEPDTLKDKEGQKDIAVPRVKTVYKVCASLVDKDKKPLAEDCKEIPKADEKEVAKTPAAAAPVNRGAAGGMPGQQQMPSRMGNDTSAMGIK